MLRKANKPLSVPKGLTVEIVNDAIQISNGKNTLSKPIHTDVSISFSADDSTLMITASESANPKTVKAQLGTICSHVSNMITGLTTGFKRELIIYGTGYKGQISGKKLNLKLGFSHDVEMLVPEEVVVEMPNQLEIILTSFDKEALGSFTDKVLRRRKLNRYSGKGIRDKHVPFVAKEVRKS